MELAGSGRCVTLLILCEKPSSKINLQYTISHINILIRLKHMKQSLTRKPECTLSRMPFNHIKAVSTRGPVSVWTNVILGRVLTQVGGGDDLRGDHTAGRRKSVHFDSQMTPSLDPQYYPLPLPGEPDFYLFFPFFSEW